MSRRTDTERVQGDRKNRNIARAHRARAAARDPESSQGVDFDSIRTRPQNVATG